MSRDDDARTVLRWCRARGVDPREFEAHDEPVVVCMKVMRSGHGPLFRISTKRFAAAWEQAQVLAALEEATALDAYLDENAVETHYTLTAHAP